MCSNRTILVISLASLFVFYEASYANRGEAVGQLMVKLGKSLTLGGSKAKALKAKSIRSEFLTEIKAEHGDALKRLSMFSLYSKEFSNHILNSARQIKSEVGFKDMTAEIIQKIEADIRLAREAVGSRRLYGYTGFTSSEIIGGGMRLPEKNYISPKSFEEGIRPMLSYLKRLKGQNNWPQTSIKDGYHSTHLSLDGEKEDLFSYAISRALDNVDDAIKLKNVGSVSATEALIKVFQSNKLLDVNSIHQMWFVVVKVFPNKIEGFLDDFVEVIFEKFAKTSYDFEVYRAAASLVKGLPSHGNSEMAQSLSEISEDIMRLGHIVNGKGIAKGSLNVISLFSVVERSGMKLSIKYSDEWVENTSRMIDDVANTGNLNDLSAKLSNAFKRAEEFGDQFVGDANLAKKVIFDFKGAILKGGKFKDEIVTIYFRWILNDRKILSISNDEVAKSIAEIIESKDLFHLMDDPEISRILDEVPSIMESITKYL